MAVYTPTYTPTTFIWLCSTLMVLNTVSYIAQLCNLQKKNGKTSTTPLYLVFNIFSATEQANLCHWYSSGVAKKSQSSGDHFAQRAREWMNLSQIATIWMLFTFLQ
ncbi:hypothetical protein N7523_000727 [Penicillium sp. IBT 18751x]|nr:hypothetical protein N7523_000727 [Penicillium sp. IBT 18751x]